MAILELTEQSAGVAASGAGRPPSSSGEGKVGEVLEAFDVDDDFRSAQEARRRGDRDAGTKTRHAGTRLQGEEEEKEEKEEEEEKKKKTNKK